MKRRLIFMLCLFFAAIGGYADEQHIVKLGDGHTSESVSLDELRDYCNVLVTVVDAEDDEDAKVTIEIENISESDVFILFGHAYAERELRKLTPSITYDKKFPGTKGKRQIDTYKESRDVHIVRPSKKILLPEINVRRGAPQSCRLPLYFANERRTNKLLLMAKQILELVITVEDKTDEDFIRLEKEYTELTDTMGKLTFCTNPQHTPSLDRQEAPFKERINKMIIEIDSIIHRHNWFTSDRGKLRYDSLKQKLTEIDFVKYERDCGNHRSPLPPRHTCKYCNIPLGKIYEKLELYYMKIYNRQVTKQEVMADVNLLYKCCVDANCSKHAPLWNRSVYKDRIIKYYNRIKNF